MAPKISSALGFQEYQQLHKNSSILSYTGDVGQNYLELDDGFGNQDIERITAILPRPNKKETRTASTSRYTLLSSSLYNARGVVVSHAKKLHVRESTCQAMSQLRKNANRSPKSSVRYSQYSTDSVETQHESNQADNDDKKDLKNAGYKCMYTKVSLGDQKVAPFSSPTLLMNRLSKYVPSRPWNKNRKQRRRFSEDLS